MIYNGLGVETLIERNKNRMRYVTQLAENETNLLTKIDNLFTALDTLDLNKVNIAIKELFFENVDTEYIEDILDYYSTLSYSKKNTLKENVIYRYKYKPTKGFIWNLYDAI